VALPCYQRNDDAVASSESRSDWTSSNSGNSPRRGLRQTSNCAIRTGAGLAEDAAPFYLRVVGLDGIPVLGQPRLLLLVADGLLQRSLDESRKVQVERPRLVDQIGAEREVRRCLAQSVPACSDRGMPHVRIGYARHACHASRGAGDLARWRAGSIGPARAAAPDLHGKGRLLHEVEAVGSCPGDGDVS
jgi:hypothetical protein